MTAEEKAEKLIQAHDGDMALLYIYLSRRAGADIRAAARDLFMTLERAESAYERLELQGFFGASGEKPEAIPAGPEQHALYTSLDIERASEDPVFKAVIQEGQQVTGRILTKDDMGRLLDIYKNLGIPADVIFVLLHYCAEVSDRKLRLSYVQKVAYTWHELGVETAEQAEAYVENDLARRSDLGRVKAALHIYDRDFTNREREMACSWLDMHFTEKDISEAYEICVDKNGKYISAYINKILENWYRNGKDRKNTKKTAGKAAQATPGPLPASIRKKK